MSVPLDVMARTCGYYLEVGQVCADIEVGASAHVHGATGGAQECLFS